VGISLSAANARAGDVVIVSAASACTAQPCWRSGRTSILRRLRCPIARRCSACPMRCFRRFRSRGPCATPRAADSPRSCTKLPALQERASSSTKAAVPVPQVVRAHARFSAWILYIWRTKAGLSPLSLRNRPAPRLRRCTPIPTAGTPASSATVAPAGRFPALLATPSAAPVHSKCLPANFFQDLLTWEPISVPPSCRWCPSWAGPT